MKYFFEDSTFVTFEIVALFSQQFSLLWWALLIPDSLNVFIKKTDDCFKHSSYCPSWVPLLRMVLRNCQTNFSIGLESSIFIHEDNIWRLERILKRKQYLTMIKALMKVTIFRSLDSKVPIIQIILQWCSFNIRKGLFDHVTNLLINSRLTDIALHLFFWKQSFLFKNLL